MQSSLRLLFLRMIRFRVINNSKGFQWFYCHPFFLRSPDKGTHNTSYGATAFTFRYEALILFCDTNRLEIRLATNSTDKRWTIYQEP